MNYDPTLCLHVLARYQHITCRNFTKMVLCMSKSCAQSPRAFEFCIALHLSRWSLSSPTWIVQNCHNDSSNHKTDNVAVFRRSQMYGIQFRITKNDPQTRKLWILHVGAEVELLIVSVMVEIFTSKTSSSSHKHHQKIIKGLGYMSSRCPQDRRRLRNHVVAGQQACPC
jgi:hypothetical protein